MKFIKNRNEFIKSEKVLLEKFDMSGGPMGNDINWGDSLVGRLLNAVGRKVKIGIDTKRVDLIGKKIESEFNDLLSTGISRESNESTLEFIKISYLLGDLRKSVSDGKEVSYLINQTQNLIDYVKKTKVSKKSNNKYEISNESKEELLRQLNDFLNFLKGIGDVSTGIESSGEDVEDLDDNVSSNKEGLNYAEMVTLLKRLKGIIDTKDSIKTYSQDTTESEERATNINYVLKMIVSSIREQKSDFDNDLLSNSKKVNNIDLKWPLLEVKGNSIFYRKVKKIVELKSDGNLLVDIPKFDSRDKSITGSIGQGESAPRLIKFNKKNIRLISKYLTSKLNNIKSVINSNNNLKLNREEVRWFNEKIKGKWIVIYSRNNNYYTTSIGECDDNGRVYFLNKPVKKQQMNVNTILSKGVIFNDKESARKYYNSKYQSGERVLSKKGDVARKTTSFSSAQRQNVDAQVQMSESYYRYLYENLNKNDEYLNSALTTFKRHIKSMANDGNVTSNLLGDIISDAQRPESKEIIKKFLKDIKDAYNRIGDIGKLYKESVNYISNPSKRQIAADKIARFAKMTLQLEPQMYGGLDEMGKNIKSFNDLFKKLLNTNFENIARESVLTTYKSFIMINEYYKESSYDDIVDFFNSNFDFERWIIEENEVESIKSNIENYGKSAKKFSFDNILEIVKHFNRAYKIYTTPVIPSGRSNGKVSNRKYREYTYIGTGSPGEPDRPGYGPWRNNKVFDKFESSILDIIKSNRYKSIFDGDVVLNDGRVVKNGGKILLKFINNLLDGDSFYKSGVQNKFIQEYFGITDVNMDKTLRSKYSKDNKKSTNLADEVGEVSERFKFRTVRKATKTRRALYAIESDKNTYYFIILDADNENIYIKISNSFQKLKEYYTKSDIKISNGDLDNINLEKVDLFFGRINKKYFDIKNGQKIKIELFSIKKYKEDMNSVSSKSIEINVRNIYTLGKGMNIAKLPDNAKTAYDYNDSSDYENLKKYFN